MLIVESPRPLSKHEALVKNVQIQKEIMRIISLYFNQVGDLTVHMK
jgi:hypothetical protein